MTRYFYHGRTETVRSCTVEAVRWCQSMQDPSTSVSIWKEKIHILLNCPKGNVALESLSQFPWISKILSDIFPEVFKTLVHLPVKYILGKNLETGKTWEEAHLYHFVGKVSSIPWIFCHYWSSFRITPVKCRLFQSAFYRKLFLMWLNVFLKSQIPVFIQFLCFVLYFSFGSI